MTTPRTYRVYKIDPNGHISAPPELIECADDAAAVAEARKYVDGHDIELWDNGRRVAVFSRTTDH
jgi:hypothetical protein